MIQYMSKNENNDITNICDCVRDKLHCDADGPKHYCVFVAANKKNRCFKGKGDFRNELQ